MVKHTAPKQAMPAWLSWWSMLAWMVPELVFAGLLLYAMWVSWSLH